MPAIEFIKGYYPYLFLVALFIIGLYAMMVKQNLMKKIMGMSMVQSATILLWIVSAYKEGGTVTILDKSRGLDNPDLYLNPLPHTLMLTAIVVAVVTLGVAFALIIRIYRQYKTLDEPLLLERMK
ncbi:NADH-ubiquinone oxidoreductase chain 4L [Alkalidesulfovibrio alkalitolerans DSM 16529]|jgi:multicomponent Na+:H+ antiporter subunit C|uniref:NADH-ubiquinone oxidoreductase chain 4L n=1 Tax=Alkalidesulfovibrio alkalitolerans DSM 16529 TaxID=1121439 RepID=S7T7J3_9BACT|nr:cation:proton antiporter subunit C [Alkalidesulfovibrio alkalitolerans]EPR33087.1 NADH-ubiquinone oxidoreductase chain 4L [Alkalidesulfovibrio alkalitolerans DSM 16529]